MKEKRAKIIGIILMTFYAVYALVASIFQFTRGVSGLVDGFIILVIGFVFCLIMGLSFFGKGASFMRRMNRQAEAQALENAIEENAAEEQPSKKPLTAEEKKKKRSDLIAGIGVFAICIAVASGIWYYAARQIALLHAPNFIEVEATLVKMVYDGENSRLFYSFYDLNGKLQYALSPQSWSGVKFLEGNTVTVYYHSMHPEVIREPSTPVMLFLVGGAFALIGTIAGLHQSGHTKPLPFIAGAIFIMIPVGFEIGLTIAGGFTFWQLTVSGGLVYACNAFLVLGVYCLCVGVASVIKAVKAARRRRI